jgi:hypothetical protein
MPLSLKTTDREKVNIRPNEFVVSVVANRPHNRLIENDIQIAEYINAMTLQDLDDVGIPGADQHTRLAGGDNTQDGESTPNFLMRYTDQDNFVAEPMDQIFVNILRPSIENGQLRIGPGYWNTFTDPTKTATIPVSMNVPLYHTPDQGAPAPFWEYVAMETSTLTPVVYSSEIAASSGPGIYVAAIRVELVDGTNQVVEVLDKRPFLNPTSAAADINLTGAFVDLEPWVETHYITADIDAGAVIVTHDACHTYQPGGTLVVYHNRGRLSRCDDYVEIGPREIRLNINLREGDKIILQHLVGVQETIIQGIIGDYSPSYNKIVMQSDQSPGYQEDVGFPFESGLGWLTVFRNGKKLCPNVDYREEEDDRTVTFLIDLLADDVLEYHYAMGFTRLFAAAGAPDIARYENKEVPFVGQNIDSITSGFGFEDYDFHAPDDVVEVSQVELDLEIVSTDGSFSEAGQIYLYVDWEADTIIYSMFWKGFTTAIAPYSGHGEQNFTGTLNTIEVECGEVVLFAEVDSSSRQLNFIGIKEHNNAVGLDSDQTLLLSQRIHNWSQRSNSRKTVVNINSSGTYPLTASDKNKWFFVYSADAVFTIPVGMDDGVVFNFVKATSDASIKVETDTGDDVHGEAGGYILTDDSRDAKSTITMASSTLLGAGSGPTSWALLGGDGRWKLYDNGDVLVRSMMYGIDEEEIINSASAGNYKYDTRSALGNTSAAAALAYADAALGGLPNGSELVVVYQYSQSVYNGNSGGTVTQTASGRYLKQSGTYVSY